MAQHIRQQNALQSKHKRNLVASSSSLCDGGDHASEMLATCGSREVHRLLLNITAAIDLAGRTEGRRSLLRDRPAVHLRPPLPAPLRQPHREPGWPLLQRWPGRP